MSKILTKRKIKKELDEFKKFKESFVFNQKEIEEKQDGSFFCDGVCLREGKDGKWIGETETFVNVGYKIHGAFPKVLSNLFHYEFEFRGNKISSIEAIFQSFKFKDPKLQRMIFSYSGLDSNNIKVASDYDWKKENVVYFQGQRINRDSGEYADFVDEMYISLLQNPLYRNCLKNVGGKYILHAMGENDKTKTVFTRYEFEYQLNCLKAFVQSKS